MQFLAWDAILLPRKRWIPFKQVLWIQLLCNSLIPMGKWPSGCTLHKGSRTGWPCGGYSTRDPFTRRLARIPSRSGSRDFIMMKNVLLTLTLMSVALWTGCATGGGGHTGGNIVVTV